MTDYEGTIPVTITRHFGDLATELNLYRDYARWVLFAYEPPGRPDCYKRLEEIAKRFPLPPHDEPVP